MALFCLIPCRSIAGDQTAAEYLAAALQETKRWPNTLPQHCRRPNGGRIPCRSTAGGQTAAEYLAAALQESKGGPIRKEL